MGKEETVILIFTSVAAIFLLCISFVVILVLHRNRKLKHSHETKFMQQLHERQLLQNQFEIQAQTMQHIGTEIHDNVGQKLTLASLYTKQFSNRSVEEMETKITAVGNIIDESLTELRQLSKTLTNPELANASLEFLLNEEAKRINVSGICYVSINNSCADIVLPQADKNILFRLLQEFVQNSLKHSDCRRISIALEKMNEKLFITATDDGKGFDTSDVSTGIGLQNMKRRAEQLNALYQLSSESGKGTTLTLQLTLTK
jgi:signal transduction histidine kinase